MYSVCFTINILSLSTTNTLTLSSISFISTTLIPTQIKRYGGRLGHRDSRIGEKSW